MNLVSYFFSLSLSLKTYFSVSVSFPSRVKKKKKNKTLQMNKKQKKCTKYICAEESLPHAPTPHKSPIQPLPNASKPALS